MFSSIFRFMLLYWVSQMSDRCRATTYDYFLLCSINRFGSKISEDGEKKCPSCFPCFVQPGIQIIKIIKRLRKKKESNL